MPTPPGPKDRLLLASASPRRRALLAAVGLACDVQPVGVDERPRPHEAADETARRLALSKARAARRRAGGRTILAADTVVVVDGCALGKPEDRDEARAMLRRLSGRWHEVVTAIALITADGRERVDHARTGVRFAELDDDEIERYTAGQEPFDKAGAYGIQGAAAWFVEEVRGSVTNVVGLPLELVRALGRAAGLEPQLVPIDQDPSSRRKAW
jgi:septum formation protein